MSDLAVYMRAAMQCYSKASAYLRNELPKVSDPQTKEGLALLADDADRHVREIRDSLESLENL